MGTGSSLARKCPDNYEDEDHYEYDEIADEVRDYKNRHDDGAAQVRRTFSGIRSISLKKSCSSKEKAVSKEKGVVTKSSSLRSARSFEIELSEMERFRREFDFYRIRKITEIAELEVNKEKLESENRRLRGELKILQLTCMKLRNEREHAFQAEEQALQRAAALEMGTYLGKWKCIAFPSCFFWVYFFQSV